MTEIRGHKHNPQIPFYATPMSKEALDQWNDDRDHYLDMQLEILLTVAADEEKVVQAYRDGWHMRVGMN